MSGNVINNDEHLRGVMPLLRATVSGTGGAACEAIGTVTRIAGGGGRALLVTRQ